MPQAQLQIVSEEPLGIVSDEPLESDTGRAGALTGLSKAETIGQAPTGGELAMRRINEPGPEGAFLRAVATGGAAPINEISAAPAGLMKVIGDVLDRSAISSVRSAIKRPWAEAQRRAGIEGTDADTSTMRLAKFIIDKGLWTAKQARELGRASGKAVDEATVAAEAANPDLVVDTAERIPTYLNALGRRIEGRTDPGDARAALQNYGRRLVNDSPISRSTYVAPPPETLEEGLIRGMREGVAAAENVGKRGPVPASSHQFTTEGGAFPQSSRPRELRPDMKPSELLPIIRAKSVFNPATAPEAREAAKTGERAIRDSFKEAVPEAVGPLKTQGSATDAERALTRAAWRDANRDTLGLGAIAGMANKAPGIGILLQLLKEGQMATGQLVGGAARGVRSGQAPTLIQRLIAAATSGQSPIEP